MKSSNETIYYLIFDTNALFQAYEKKSDFTTFSFNATYENVIDCLKDSVISKLDIPIIYNADVSHKGPCLNIINGVITEVEVKKNKGKIKFKISE